jgi:NADPH-dependent 2,4-dienoyl-CoA reductase/sulfur reductase-like enzyme
MSKIVIIGANHSGIAAANTILGSYPDNELVIIERNTNISYLGCGTALWLGGQIDGTDKLFYTNPENFVDLGAKLLSETSVTKIDFEKKIVYAQNKDSSDIKESYDKLILATGSSPITPKVDGVNLKNVEYVKLFQDGQAIDKALDNPAIKSVAVIGAGYIGVEIAEAVERRGKKSLLFDMAPTLLSTYFDPWFSDDLVKVLDEHKVEQHYGETLLKIEGGDAVTGIVTDKGKYAVELVILAIGFRPNNELGKGHLDTVGNGAYKVTLGGQTSDKDVYAIGDCASIYSNATQSFTYIALATNAVRSGIIAAHNACGTALNSIGVQGSNGISIYGYNMVSTGLNLESAKKAGIEASYTEFEDLQKPAFMKSENHKVKVRIVYDKQSRRIVGAQMASYQDISMGLHVFSLAIEEKLTIEKFSLLDIFFLPHFNQPYNYITMAALSAK